jgi:hypothetical protein
MPGTPASDRFVSGEWRISVANGFSADFSHMSFLTANSPYHQEFEHEAGNTALWEPWDLGSVRMVTYSHLGIISGLPVRTKPLARRTLARVRCRRLKRWSELWS